MHGADLTFWYVYCVLGLVSRGITNYLCLKACNWVDVLVTKPTFSAALGASLPRLLFYSIGASLPRLLFYSSSKNA